MRTAPGADQSMPLRHEKKPLPYLAPMPNAPCFMPGITTMHCAWRIKFMGIPLSGVDMISPNTVAALFKRLAVGSAWSSPIGRHSNRVNVSFLISF
jgi:hypothetical protein